MPPPPRPVIDGKLRCAKCDSWKLAEGFSRDASKATGRRAYCRECNSAGRAAWRSANPEKGRVYRSAWDAANPEKQTAYSRAASLRKNGWTVESYDAALVAQGGKCANPGCDVQHSAAKPLHADHDHKTGLARVLLCNGCNCALGHLGEDSQRIAGLLKLNDSFTN